jgi:hypothetical protein
VVKAKKDSFIVPSIEKLAAVSEIKSFELDDVFKFREI